MILLIIVGLISAATAKCVGEAYCAEMDGLSRTREECDALKQLGMQTVGIRTGG